MPEIILHVCQMASNIVYIYLFLINNIHVVLMNQVFHQSVGRLLGIDCITWLAELFLYSHEAEFIQKHVREKKRNHLL